MDKSLLRKIVLDKRKSLTLEEVNQASGIIVERLSNLSFVKESSVIMTYMPYGNEVDITPLNQWILNQGKTLLLPRVISKNATMSSNIVAEINAFKVDSLSDGFVRGSFGILEPSIDKEPYDISKIETILVPGVAFDKQGNRIGHGKGFYDRFLAKCEINTVFIGVGYTFQVFDSIPFNEHDIRVHYVITD